MPNSTRLYPLIELREAVGLSQADMAQRCGLQGNQSRKTAGSWETGEVIPRTSRRIGFMRYLWSDLQLHRDPTRFAEIWAILVEEWAWAPVSAVEYAELQTRLSSPALAVNPEHNETAIIEIIPVETTTFVLPAAPPVVMGEEPAILPNEPGAPISTSTNNLLERLYAVVPRQAFFIGAPLLLLLVAVLFWCGNAMRHTPPEPPIPVTSVPSFVRITDPLSATIPATPLSMITATLVQPATNLPAANQVKTTPSLLRNGGFDEHDGFDGWDLYEECDYQIATDPTWAYDGNHYLIIQNRRPRCYSVYQDVFTPLTVGATYHGAIWLRSPTGYARRGRLSLWALGTARIYSNISFVVDTMTWTCLETTLTIRQPLYDQLRLEVYLDSHDGFEYDLDGAVLRQGTENLCPTPRLIIAELQLVQPSGRIYPGATVGVQSVVKNISASALPNETFVRYWVAEQAGGGPIDPNASRQVSVPPLTAGESATTMHMDVYLPFNLSTDQRYFLVADLIATEHPDTFSRGLDRTARSFAILPCEQGTFFCDVPADHWAAIEIQAWSDAGITQGCRSNTEPFLNRPFCPDGVVQRWMMAFFLMRWLEGVDYQPLVPYQGLFEDVPADFEGKDARLIEVLTTKWVDLDSETCPPRGRYRHFCPRDPLLRVDFVRALLSLQHWDLTDIEGKVFSDMEAGTEEARAAEYMWRQGYLPTNDTDCPGNAGYRRFCPNAPLRRASAAVMMSRALGLVKSDK